jgi:hypothetical protein
MLDSPLPPLPWHLSATPQELWTAHTIIYSTRIKRTSPKKIQKKERAMSSMHTRKKATTLLCERQKMKNSK